MGLCQCICFAAAEVLVGHQVASRQLLNLCCSVLGTTTPHAGHVAHKRKRWAAQG